MSSGSIVSVDAVSKAYPIYARPADMLKESLFGGTRHDLFWALRDVSFSISEKQRVGIIGPNGAGKSTLLQIITGNLLPTSGSVRVVGKVSALLSMTPAWNGEDSGLDNIRFNLLVQGCDPDQIPTLTEEIIDFTEIGPFIYRPVKTYSTGMGARLAFAIATAISPEILVIDEVLGVGDGYFASKANQRLRDMCDRGRALILVSHSLAAIRSFCDTAMWLENGEVRLIGNVEQVVSKYEEDTFRADEETLREGNIRRLRETMHLVSPEDIPEEAVCRIRLRECGATRVHRVHYVRAIYLLDAEGEKTAIPLHHVDFRKPDVDAALDLTGCEWGRLYAKHGEECRMLSPRTGARKGGHLLLKRPTRLGAREWPLRFVVEADIGPDESSLEADLLDPEGPTWHPLTLRRRSDASRRWVQLEFTGVVPAVSSEVRAAALERAAIELRPPVQILEIAIVADGMATHHIQELQPFSIRVRIRQHERIPATSVNLNVVRADGVYAFYQPSGLAAGNILDFLGDATIDFTFDPNPFGAGEYEANVFVCNGWSWENVPPSDVYDRSIGSFRFAVGLRRPIPFGLINLSASVAVSLIPGAETEAQSLPTDESCGKGFGTY